MRISSVRKDVVVIDGGVPGVCAAIAAARNGANVALVTAEYFLGGFNAKHAKYPLEIPVEASLPIGRENGLLDEVLSELMFLNKEGTYFGFSQALHEIIKRENRISVHWGEFLLEANLNKQEDSLESLLSIDQGLQKKNLFRSSFFIDCSIEGKLGRMTNTTELIASEVEEDSSSQRSDIEDFNSTACVIDIARSDEKISFALPEWVRLRWEDNAMEPKLDLMESLSIQLIGEHLVEWYDSTTIPKTEEIVLCAWDYLKNRSPVSKLLENFYLRDTSLISFSSNFYRGNSVHDLTLREVHRGTRQKDVVVISRSPPPAKNGLIFSPRGRSALPYPFEIPLRSLRSQKLNNLFWMGDSIFSPDEKSVAIIHTPTLSQMAEASGIAASLLCEKKNSFSQSKFLKKVRYLLSRKNSLSGKNQEVDRRNLALSAKISASSTLTGYIPKNSKARSIYSLKNCMIQFPVSSGEISTMEIMLEISKPMELEIKLFAGSSYNLIFPGKCLHSEVRSITDCGSSWLKIELGTKVENEGWHFMELKSAEAIGIHLQENSPFGVFLHRPRKASENKLKNSFTEFFPILGNQPRPARGPMIKTNPVQDVFSESNAINSFFRPTNLPNLWISDSTDFKYPEFVELNWDNPVSIKCMEITFDGSMNFYYPPRPRRLSSNLFTSLVKDYNIYYSDEKGHSHKLISVRNNRKVFRIHEFDEIITSSIEIEIISTNGLNRAQIFQIRLFNEKLEESKILTD